MRSDTVNYWNNVSHEYVDENTDNTATTAIFKQSEFQDWHSRLRDSHFATYSTDMISFNTS